MRRSVVIAIAVVALLATALAANAVVADRHAEPASAAAGGTVMELPGADLNVRERGPAGAPAVVLLHCYTCSLRYWSRLEPRLAGGRRVVSIDLLGHGGSEKPRDGYGIPRQADLVAAALRRLDVADALVVGQSLGGAVATALAERHPERVGGVVVMDSPPRPESGDLPLTARLARAPVIGPALDRLATDGVVRDGLERAFHEGFEVPDELVEDVRAMTVNSFSQVPERAEEYVGRRPLDERLAALDVPLLVVFGAEDRIVDPAAADRFRDVPGAEVVLLPGVGHTPQLEAPARTAALVRRFDLSLGASGPSARRQRAGGRGP